LVAQALHVSVGSFLDLRYLTDSGRLSAAVLEHVRSIVDGDGFTVVPLDLPILDASVGPARAGARSLRPDHRRDRVAARPASRDR
jgi:hypothetical protein